MVEQNDPRRRSPFAPYADVLSAMPQASQVREIPFLAMASVRTPEPWPGLPTTANTFAGQGDDVTVWLGPDEWLVISPANPAELVARLEQQQGETRGAVVDVSGQRTVLELSGSRARDLLAHGCALDLTAAAAPAGTSHTTLLAHANVTIMVRDAGESPTFWLLVRSSFARYVAHWLEDAGTEYRGG